jgi:PAS domain S-box-containing protein
VIASNPYQPQYNPSKNKFAFVNTGYGYPTNGKPGSNQQIPPLFSSFINARPHAAWITDEQCNLVYANNAFYYYFNVDEGVGNKNLHDIIPVIYSGTLLQKHIKVLTTGKVQTLQHKILNAAGVEETLLIHIFLFYNNKGNKMIGGEAMKLSNQRQLMPQEEKLGNNLLEPCHPATTANWEWNMVTNHIYRNPVMQAITGFANNAAQNLSWWFSRIHPGDCKRVRDSIKHILETLGHNWQCEYRFKNKAGNYITVHDRAFVIYANKQPIKMFGSFEDVTQIKKQGVTEADEKINEQKIIAESFLTIEEEGRGRISNELNENINQMLAAAKMFMENIVPTSPDGQENKDTAIEYLLMGMQEVKKLYKETLTKEPLLESGLTNNISMLVNDLKLGSSINVCSNFQDDFETLSPGKKSTVFRIVQEQFKNIAQHSKAKNVAMEIKLEKGNVELMIKDDGVSFRPEEIKWGIGFSTIHQRIKLYNGSIIIKTAPCKGCKMVVKIPLGV